MKRCSFILLLVLFVPSAMAEESSEEPKECGTGKWHSQGMVPDLIRELAQDFELEGHPIGGIVWGPDWPDRPYDEQCYAGRYCEMWANGICVG